MFDPVTTLAVLAALVSGMGLIQVLAGAALVARFVRQPGRTDGSQPPITVLKPLHGAEPLLEAALASACQQDYPRWQVVVGVQDASDTALPVVRRLQARFPACDIAVVVDPTVHGENRKVGNLINMLPAAKHNVVVIADSDIHVSPAWLRQLASSLEGPAVGLVTTLYTGRPSADGMVGGIGAMQINHYFLPGAVLARALGRQDCLGATMMLRRDTLERIGGFEALVNHLADDNVLGRLVQSLGLGVALADTVPQTTVPETTFAALWRHELRWARTIRALVPVKFAASALQYCLIWAALAVLLSAAATWSLGLLAAAGVVRALAAWVTDRALGLAKRTPLWLLPLRELMSVAVMVASYTGRRVEWRGHTMQAPRVKSGGVGRGFNPR